MPKEAIYERVIYIIPYNSRKMVEKIQGAFRDLNLEGLGIKGGSIRDLNTKSLTELEKANRNLDVLTGFELIDSEKRMYVFEGLSNGAMRKILKYLPRDRPPSEAFSQIKNRSVKFQERMYMDFHVKI